MIQVADAVLDQGFDFRVFHVPGIHNQVADSLSRLQNAQLEASHLEMLISAFQPPGTALGAAAP